MKRSNEVLFIGVVLALICSLCGVLILENPLNIAAGLIACLTFLSGMMCFCTYHVIRFFEKLYDEQY